MVWMSVIVQFCYTSACANLWNPFVRINCMCDMRCKNTRSFINSDWLSDRALDARAPKNLLLEMYTEIPSYMLRTVNIVRVTSEDNSSARRPTDRRKSTHESTH